MKLDTSRYIPKKEQHDHNLVESEEAGFQDEGDETPLYQLNEIFYVDEDGAIYKEKGSELVETDYFSFLPILFEDDMELLSQEQIQKTIVKNPLKLKTFQLDLENDLFCGEEFVEYGSDDIDLFDDLADELFQIFENPAKAEELLQKLENITIWTLFLFAEGAILVNEDHGTEVQLFGGCLLNEEKYASFVLMHLYGISDQRYSLSQI